MTATEESEAVFLKEKVAQEYREACDILDKNGFEASRDLDKWLLTIAGAALGLSFTFLKDVVNLTAANALWLLGFGWLSLVSAVALSLFSLYTGQRAHVRYRECLDDAALKGLDVTFAERAREAQSKRVEAKLTEWLNLFAVLTALAGLGLLLVFVFVNFISQGASYARASQPVVTATASVSGPGPSTANASASIGILKSPVEP